MRQSLGATLKHMWTNKTLFPILKYFINVALKLLNYHYGDVVIIDLKQDMTIALRAALVKGIIMLSHCIGLQSKI